MLTARYQITGDEFSKDITFSSANTTFPDQILQQKPSLILNVSRIILGSLATVEGSQLVEFRNNQVVSSLFVPAGAYTMAGIVRLLKQMVGFDVQFKEDVKNAYKGELTLSPKSTDVCVNIPLNLAFQLGFATIEQVLHRKDWFSVTSKSVGRVNLLRPLKFLSILGRGLYPKPVTLAYLHLGK